MLLDCSGEVVIAQVRSWIRKALQAVLDGVTIGKRDEPFSLDKPSARSVQIRQLRRTVRANVFWFPKQLYWFP